MRSVVRVSVFLGKGGVGRTTLATAFAWARASAGERVALVSLANGEDLSRRLRDEAPTTNAPVVLAIDPRALVDDLVRAVLNAGPLTGMLLRSPAYASLVDIAPGIREMAVLNHVWNLREAGNFDRIILDAPATGHGLHFLEAPEKASALLVGKLRERARAVERMVKDGAAFEVVLVTIPEETPVRETVELADHLKARGIVVDNVVVNRWLPDVFANEGSATVLASLRRDAARRRRLSRAIAHRTRIDVEDWLAAVDIIEEQRAEALEHRARLDAIGAKVSLVPLLPERTGRLAAVAKHMGVLP